MSTDLSTEISPEIINSLILTGDMSQLKPAQQTAYYTAVCKALELNPLTQPFAIITLQGKKTLYATKGCTQQLANVRKIDTEVLSREVKDTVYIVSVRATMPDGRKTDEDGIVGIAGLKGNDLANAMLKAITKAKRRAVLALCGLNMSDETEIDDTIRHEMQADNTKSRVENIIDAQCEVKENVGIDNKETVEKVTETIKKTSEKVGKESKVKSGDKSSEPIQHTLPEGHKTVQGLIDNSLVDGEGKILSVKKMIVNHPITKKDEEKWVFLLEGNKYGTFDKKLANEIMECVDNRILINIEYKERPSGEKILRDIVSFTQVTVNQVPI
jgi:hypothetical protein